MGKRPWGRLFKAIIGVVICVVGIYFGYDTYQKISLGNASEEWPTADGVIHSSKVKTTESTRRRGGKRVSYSPEITYSYTVDGQKHNGSNFSFAPASSSDQQEVNMIVAELRPGIEINVHYNPDDPTMSVLIPGSVGSQSFLMYGAFIVGLGALVYAGFQMKEFMSPPVLA